MKITIQTPRPNEEDEIIVKCRNIDDNLMKLICRLKEEESKITAYLDREIVQLLPKDIYYFEAVDNKVFAYCESQVYEVKEKLYELENQLAYMDFVRISKSVIVSIFKIRSISPMLNGKLEGKLKNGEKVIISRQYVPTLKKALGIKER